MQFDNDLVDIFNTIAKGQRTEAWTLQTIVRLVMNLQEVRRTLQVAGKLTPEQMSKPPRDITINHIDQDSDM